jgi:hypothetical protein
MKFDGTPGGAMRRDDLTHRDDIMKADLLSEIVLLSSGVVIFVSLLMVLVVALSSASPT